MPDQTLAQLIKAKYPVYAKVPDDQLEAMVDKKHPGSYAGIPRTPAPEPIAPELLDKRSFSDFIKPSGPNPAPQAPPPTSPAERMMSGSASDFAKELALTAIPGYGPARQAGLDLPTAAAIAAGVASGGASIPAQMAATAAAGGVGKMGQQQINQGLHVPSGADVQSAGLEGVKQGAITGVMGGLGKTLQGAGRLVYGAGVNPSLKGVPSGAVDAGLANRVVTGGTADTIAQQSQQAVADQLAAATSQRTVPSTAITADPAKQAAQRLIPDAFSSLRSTVGAGPTGRSGNAALDAIAQELHASHPSGLTLEGLDQLRQAAQADAGAALPGRANQAIADRVGTILESRSPGYGALATDAGNLRDLAQGIGTSGAQQNLPRRLLMGASGVGGFFNPLSVGMTGSLSWLGTNPAAMRALGIGGNEVGAAVSNLGPTAIRALALQQAGQQNGVEQNWWSPRPQE